MYGQRLLAVGGLASLVAACAYALWAFGVDENIEVRVAEQTGLRPRVAEGLGPVFAEDEARRRATDGALEFFFRDDGPAARLAERVTPPRAATGWLSRPLNSPKMHGRCHRPVSPASSPGQCLYGQCASSLRVWSCSRCALRTAPGSCSEPLPISRQRSDDEWRIRNSRDLTVDSTLGAEGVPNALRLAFLSYGPRDAAMQGKAVVRIEQAGQAAVCSTGLQSTKD